MKQKYRCKEFPCLPISDLLSFISVLTDVTGISVYFQSKIRKSFIATWFSFSTRKVPSGNKNNVINERYEIVTHL